jgi:hypothetical protein
MADVGGEDPEAEIGVKSKGQTARLSCRLRVDK